MFTKTELNFIKSIIKLQGIADHIANRYGTCSREYVSKVLKSKTPPKTKKAIAITEEFRKVLKCLKEEND